MVKKITKNDEVVLEHLVNKYGRNKLLTEMKWPSKGKLGALIGAGLIAGATLFGPNSGCHNTEPIEQRDTTGIYNNPYGIPNYDYDKIKVKQKAVKTYIASVLALHNKTLDDIQFDPDWLVVACYQNEYYDIPLLLAQLQIESHFGTTDRARRTNSMFSVGAYDNGVDAVKYKDQNSSIVPYIQLINKNYLLNGKKDVDQLLTNFVNGSGNRYASNTDYEKHLRVTRNKIIQLHPELLNDYECFD